MTPPAAWLPAFALLVEALCRDWHAYLAGDIDRQTAIARVVAIVTAGDDPAERV